MNDPLRFARRALVSAVVVLPLMLAQHAHAQRDGALRFEKEVIDTGFSGGYGATVADIDGDGAVDVLALAYRPSELAWYRNPGWEKMVIETELDGLIDAAPHDIDGDGHVDLAVASAFSLGDSESGGKVSWLRNHRGSGEEEAPRWTVHAIDSIPTSHRLRWADVSGTGARVLINLPIIGTGAAAPQYRGGAELTAYTVAENPAEPWGHVVLDDSLEMAHGLYVTDWDDDGRDELLTASYSGIELIDLASRGQFVTRDTLVAPQYTERPRAGISDVVAGAWRGEERFLASIEPWHGNEVVVYRRAQGHRGSWQRTVIDESLVSGHALLAVDLDNDGRDEIVAGGRGEPHALNVYRYDEAAGRWQRRELDQGVAVSGLAASDLDGNGFMDIVAVGASTANVVIYHNMGR